MPDNATSSSPTTASLDADQAEVQLRELVATVRTLMLATAGPKGEPEASYAPCTFDNQGRAYVYVSALSKHTAHLRAAGTISAMLIEDEATAESLYARRRVTWNCAVEAIARDSALFTERMAAFRARFGEIIEVLEAMQDFQLFALTPRDGRLVLGFGAAFRITGHQVQRQMQGRHQTGK